MKKKLAAFIMALTILSGVVMSSRQSMACIARGDDDDDGIIEIHSYFDKSKG